MQTEKKDMRRERLTIPRRVIAFAILINKIFILHKVLPADDRPRYSIVCTGINPVLEHKYKFLDTSAILVKLNRTLRVKNEHKLMYM